MGSVLSARFRELIEGHYLFALPLRIVLPLPTTHPPNGRRLWVSLRENYARRAMKNASPAILLVVTFHSVTKLCCRTSRNLQKNDGRSYLLLKKKINNNNNNNNNNNYIIIIIIIIIIIVIIIIIII